MKIALMGDIASFGRYCLKNDNTLFHYFDSVKKRLADFDLVIGNLEAPFVVNENAISGKSATVSADPVNIELLNYIGFTHLNLANNHIGDYGKHGYERTKTLIEKNDIEWFGTEDKQIRLNFNGEKISMLGFCSFNTNPSPVKSKSKLGLNYLDVNKAIEKLKDNAENGYFNILSIHSGQEHIHMPSSDDIKFARYLANRFDYVYYGHHPHVIQGFEKVNNSAIFYSLGNFIFDDVYTPRDKNNPLITLSEANKTGLIGEVEIKDGVLVSTNATPVYMGSDRMLVGDEVSVVDQDVYNSYLSNAGSSNYNEKRQAAISEYINKRREMRNLKWFLNRLNFNSVGILLKARKNSKLYHNHFVSKISSLEASK